MISDGTEARPVSVPYAPLLPVVGVLVAGYFCARVLPGLGAGSLLLAGLINLTAAMVLRGTARRALALGALGLGGIFLAWGWFEFRAGEPDPEWQGLPPRAVSIEAKILQTWRPDEARDLQRGLARVTKAPPEVSDLVGQRIIYRVREAPAIERHSEWVLEGVVRYLQPDTTFLAAMRERGVFFELARAKGAESVEGAGRLRDFFRGLNTKVTRILTGSGSMAQERATLAALFLGQRQLLDPEQNEAYIATGTRHLFAVSGLHVGLVAVVLWWTLRTLQVKPTIASVAILPLLWVYVETTGGAPSAWRAFLMIAAYCVARAITRQPSALPAWTLSALVVLVIDPWQLFDPGFQLSYAVVLGLIMMVTPAVGLFRAHVVDTEGPPPTSWAWGIQRWLMLYVFGALMVSWAAFLASAPLTVHFFGIFTPGTVLLSTVLAFPALLAVGSAVFATIFGLAGVAPVAEVFVYLGAWTIATMETAVATGPRVPGLFWGGLPQPGWLVTLLAQGLMLAAIAAVPFMVRAGRPRLAFSLAPTWLCLMLVGVLIFTY